MSVHVFGIRHHGPGSARSVRAALDALEPDIVLVEGPPDAQDVLSLAAQDGMKPPVALLLYASDAPSQAVFYPFATFSPEWQAIRFAFERRVPARFMDLPQAHQLVPKPPKTTEGEEPPEDEPPEDEEPADEESLADDPIGMLANAAGYTDRELWWEQQVEQRRDPQGLFEGILEAMRELRADREIQSDREAQREAYMRRTIRGALKEGFTKIAVVCGAWHAPALVESRKAKDDDALLRGLPKVKIEATWIPWTYSRLSYRSGYGAGINSPGWYGHLWHCRDRAAIRWLSQAAQLLRGAGIDASSASVIEAVRLADALAALRGLSMVGLTELNEAVQTVLCNGDATPMAIIRNRLEIGGDLGEVPADTPAVPLHRDLEAKQKRLRLKPSAESKLIELDLRQPNDRAKSTLFHQLNLLSVPWGQPDEAASRSTGTFREAWRIEWRPELAVALIEANMFGNTVESAAAAKVIHLVQKTHQLPELTQLLDATILAELPEAVEQLLARIQAQAAVSADVRRIMDALSPLARAARYGTVREVPADRLLVIFDGLFERVLIGLTGACASLDDAAAVEMLQSIGQADQSLALLDRSEPRQQWNALLRALVDRDSIAGLVRGGCCRLLVEQHVIGEAELQRLARLALSPAVEATQAAAWAEGLLRGRALLLLHHDGLWEALDEWLAGISEDAFPSLVPLVRRAFSSFSPAERRAMGERVKKLGRPGGAKPASTTADADLDPARAVLVLPVLSQILGVELHERS
jgi:hypothetical protein